MFKRPQFSTLEQRFSKERAFIQVMMGPRQVGKSTLAQQLAESVPFPVHTVSADTAYSTSYMWLQQQWAAGRALAKEQKTALLIVDEIQKIENWSAVVKQLWDEDTKNRIDLHVLLLGSSTLMMQTGLSESLAGRFEIIPIPHWSFKECQGVFGLSVDEFVFWGGYPGALPLRDDWQRFKAYVKDSLIETVVAKDILMMTPIKKPALLRRLFDVGCLYSSQILSYQKMVGQLQDAGNITTLEHYLYLLGQAGLITGIDKFSLAKVRQRASSPKLMPLNSALFSVLVDKPFDAVRADHELWGRFVETAVGAHLLNTCREDDVSVFYWREGNFEVDFVLRKHDSCVPIEVKSSAKKPVLNGLQKFAAQVPCSQIMAVGESGISLETFLSHPAGYWFSL